MKGFFLFVKLLIIVCLFKACVGTDDAIKARNAEHLKPLPPAVGTYAK